MSGKKITWSLAILVIAIFTAFFIAQNVIFDAGNRLEHNLKVLSDQAENGDWEQANQSFEQFAAMWNKGKYLVSLNNAEQSYSDLSGAIDLLDGAVRHRDRQMTLLTARQIIGYWEHFKHIVPEP